VHTLGKIKPVTRDSASPEDLVDANTLLIIEDSSVQVKIIRKQLEVFTDFTILNASSLAEAEALIATHQEKLFVAIVGLNLPDAP
jgi:response regulator of citrate/malate metabolism